MQINHLNSILHSGDTWHSAGHGSVVQTSKPAARHRGLLVLWGAAPRGRHGSGAGLELAAAGGAGRQPGERPSDSGGSCWWWVVVGLWW